MNIAVYLGSNNGNSPELREAVSGLGRWIGESGNTLIYGGSESGLMGVIADSTLETGGKVVGVEPQFFLDMGLVHPGISELIATETMAERRTKMIELAECFIALPGGLGTLDEISEVMCLKALGKLEHNDAPCIMYNLNGYYDSLKNQFGMMEKWGLATDRSLGNVLFVNDLQGIKNIFAEKNQWQK